MPEIDIVDSTWIGVRPVTVAAAIADATNWRRWWPGMDLRVDEWRGPKGVRWSVLTACGGNAAGSMEVWLQSIDDGTVAHFFLRLDGTRRPLRRRERERIQHTYRRMTKQAFWGVADRLDPGRLARLAGPPTRIP
ncbi:MAG: polyketide cyclase / dehydrase and lipid transport [Jatrophihabitantaceae bacterium]